MGQQFSSDLIQVIGTILFNAMLEAGAVPSLNVTHPLLLNSDSGNSGASFQDQMQQLQRDIGNKAPTYLRDLIGRLSAFTDEPKVAGLVGLVVSMVIDMLHASSKPPSGKSTGLSAHQRISELRELMEEYLKRCRMNLSDKVKLMQDTSRLEAQLSLNLTQLKTCLLRGDCDSRSLRQWASGAMFHTQMLTHLAGLEGKMEPLAARAALKQYKEDLAQIIPVYKKYKSGTVSVVKSRGRLSASCEVSCDLPEEGAMTGLTVTDRETGTSVTIPLCELQTEMGRILEASMSDSVSSAYINLDLITSDQFAQAYLHHLFSDQGPVSKIETYFTKASNSLSTLTTKPQNTNATDKSSELKVDNRAHFEQAAEGAVAETVKGEDPGHTQRPPAQDPDRLEDESLKIRIVETQPGSQAS